MMDLNTDFQMIFDTKMEFKLFYEADVESINGQIKYNL